MAAYVIADITVLNSEVYEDYRRQVPALIEKYGGRFLVRGDASEVLEGEWKPSRLIILEFPDMDTLPGLAQDPANRRAKQHRRGGGGVRRLGIIAMSRPTPAALNRVFAVRAKES